MRIASRGNVFGHRFNLTRTLRIAAIVSDLADLHLERVAILLDPIAHRPGGIAAIFLFGDSFEIFEIVDKRRFVSIAPACHASANRHDRHNPRFFHNRPLRRIVKTHLEVFITFAADMSAWNCAAVKSNRHVCNGTRMYEIYVRMYV